MSISPSLNLQEGLHIEQSLVCGLEILEIVFPYNHLWIVAFASSLSGITYRLFHLSYHVYIFLHLLLHILSRQSALLMMYKANSISFTVPTYLVISFFFICEPKTTATIIKGN
ncbi:hypothetical protein ABFS82_09G052900 [Erythranthe guttata]